ncbi:MAG: class I SAM-dependent methyltransferase [Verrucomicrobiae bacterium]|nr:class I SAM-dependent methyltransferase [Verrucomicrobiae bacterium]
MFRSLTPEILDTLPHHHTDAIASRRDLVRVNAAMRNTSWLLQQIQRAQREFHIHQWVEVGAGDGHLGKQLARTIEKNHCHVTGLDFAPRPEQWPAAWDWQQGNLWQWDQWSKVEGVIACLVLHHFSLSQLAELGQRIQKNCRYFIAVEPVRKKIHLWQANLLTSFGMNRVTRHDASLSVKAGFRDGELTQAMGWDPQHWTITLSQTWRGAYRFIAWHK